MCRVWLFETRLETKGLRGAIAITSLPANGLLFQVWLLMRFYSYLTRFCGICIVLRKRQNVCLASMLPITNKICILNLLVYYLFGKYESILLFTLLISGYHSCIINLWYLVSDWHQFISSIFSSLKKKKLCTIF